MSQENVAVEKDVKRKLSYYLSRLLIDVDELAVGIFTDNTPHSSNMWRKIFSPALQQLYFVTEYPLIPLPQPYNPEKYDEYEEMVQTFVRKYLGEKNLFGGVFNLGSTKEEPKLNFLVVNRSLRRMEFADNVAEADDETSPPGFISKNELCSKLSVLQELRELTTILEESSSSSASASKTPSSESQESSSDSGGVTVFEAAGQSKLRHDTCEDSFEELPLDDAQAEGESSEQQPENI